MSIFTKLFLFLFAIAASGMVLSHGLTALDADLPGDMPANSRFVQTGYDLLKNEPKGEWVACRAYAASNADYCRVTDAKGIVVYQGSFVLSRTASAATDDQLNIAPANTRFLWVNGPVEGAPVPVIPLGNGDLLVPAADRDALVDRWSSNPEELHQIQGG